MLCCENMSEKNGNTASKKFCKDMAAASNSGSAEDFMEQGDLLTVTSTFGGGILGGVFS